MFQDTTRKISDIEGMENYKFYFATINGDIYSNKFKKLRKLKIHSVGKNRSYRVVQLSDGKGNAKSFYVHQIICKAFLPNHTNSWLGRKKEIDGVIESDTDRLVLSKDLSDYIKLVHLSAIKKNIPVPDTYEFFHGILNESLEEYVNRFGLKKMMYLLENS
jgi:hypothetical protein